MTDTVLTIGVVDDDDSVRVALKQLLRAAGFDARSFASAEDFLHAAEDQGVDCLIVDVNLPSMSGVALVRALAAAERRIPAILISARDDAATLGLIRCAGAIPYLRKPFSEAELLAAIASVREDDRARD
jgi:FixJ family two-component response regulator